MPRHVGGQQQPSENSAARLRRHGRLQRINEDGDCLFSTWQLGRLILGLVSATAAACRRSTVSWLRRVGANFKRYAGDETLSFWMEHDEWARPGESFNDYCARMAKQGEFGGGPEIIALSQQDKLNAAVWRFVRRDGRRDLFEMTSVFEVDPDQGCSPPSRSGHETQKSVSNATSVAVLPRLRWHRRHRRRSASRLPSLKCVVPPL